MSTDLHTHRIIKAVTCLSHSLHALNRALHVLVLGPGWSADVAGLGWFVVSLMNLKAAVHVQQVHWANSLLCPEMREGEGGGGGGGRGTRRSRNAKRALKVQSGGVLHYAYRFTHPAAGITHHLSLSRLPRSFGDALVGFSCCCCWKINISYH